VDSHDLSVSLTSGDLLITLTNGQTLSFVQANVLARLIGEMGSGNCHWHLNDCGCCVTLHGPDCAYVIGRDGHETFFAEKGCEC
jgi:hypothetical protein